MVLQRRGHSLFNRGISFFVSSSSKTLSTASPFLNSDQVFAVPLVKSELEALVLKQYSHGKFYNLSKNAVTLRSVLLAAWNNLSLAANSGDSSTELTDGVSRRFLIEEMSREIREGRFDLPACWVELISSREKIQFYNLSKNAVTLRSVLLAACEKFSHAANPSDSSTELTDGVSRRFLIEEMSREIREGRFDLPACWVELISSRQKIQFYNLSKNAVTLRSVLLAACDNFSHAANPSDSSTELTDGVSRRFLIEEMSREIREGRFDLPACWVELISSRQKIQFYNLSKNAVTLRSVLLAACDNFSHAANPSDSSTELTDGVSRRFLIEEMSREIREGRFDLPACCVELISSREKEQFESSPALVVPLVKSELCGFTGETFVALRSVHTYVDEAQPKVESEHEARSISSKILMLKGGLADECGVLEQVSMEDRQRIIEEHRRSSDEKLFDSVVVIFTATTRHNTYRPWQYNEEIESIGSGMILTNAHVAKASDDFTFLQVAKDTKAFRYKAKVTKIAYECDLALLEVESDEFWQGMSPLSFGDIPALKEAVSVIGFPQGYESKHITRGLVIGIKFHRYAVSDTKLWTIVVDAEIISGHSGGPVIMEDKVVGVAFESFEYCVYGAHIGFVIPTSVIMHFLSSTIEESDQISVFGWSGDRNIAPRPWKKIEIKVQKHYKPPSYYIFGGLVFVPFTHAYIDDAKDNSGAVTASFLYDTESQAKELDAEKELVMLSRVLRDDCQDINQDLKLLEDLVVHKVNGVEVNNLKHLIDLIEGCTSEHLKLDLQFEQVAVLDYESAKGATTEILKRYGIFFSKSENLRD